MLDNNYLPQLIDASSLLISSFDTKEILPKAMEVIKDLLKCEAASIMLIDETGKNLVFEVALGEKGNDLKQISIPLGTGIAGEVALKGQPQIIDDAYTHAGFDPSYDKKTGFKTKAILCVPLRFNKSTVGVAQAINPQKKDKFNHNDLSILSLFVNQVAMVTECARLHKKILARQSLEQELNFARTIQNSFLPQSFPESKFFSMHASTTPAREVGGDFYDVFELTKNVFGFTIGDVAGKGMGAALMMAKTSAEIKTIAQRLQSNNDPAAVLKELNDSLATRQASNLFITLIYGMILPEKNMLLLSSAGHPQPFIWKKSKPIWKKINLTNGLPVGIAANAQYTNIEIPLEKDDLFLFYTDGIAEAANELKQEFMPRLFSAIKDCTKPPQELVDSVFHNLKSFTAKVKAADDATVLIIKSL